jgi:deoxyribose-phosphate aldolase
VKIYEAEEVIKLGAQEVDMVLNIGALKSGQDEVVELDVLGVVEACHRGGAICKVILETALLTIEEKVRACVACKKAGADFVKTSTGFGPAGATAEDVALMRAVVGAQIGIKAAGGIRTLEDLKKMVSAGATRIGASASVRILEEARGVPPGGGRLEARAPHTATAAAGSAAPSY